MREHVEPIAVGEPNVGQHQIERLSVDCRHGRSPIGRDVDLVALFTEPVGH